MTLNRSPYLDSSTRLADVISAIQAMGTYGQYKLTFEEWADKITADKSKADYWKEVFIGHPEFFRLDGSKEKASLVWRRQRPRRYNPRTSTVVTTEAYEALPALERDNFSREPLSPSDIKTLIDTAINLHSRALAAESDKRWWLPLVTALVGSLVGSLMGALAA
jgi:hypothetical protein